MVPVGGGRHGAGVDDNVVTRVREERRHLVGLGGVGATAEVDERHIGLPG
jgi:hypothetical protein